MQTNKTFQEINLEIKYILEQDKKKYDKMRSEDIVNVNHRKYLVDLSAQLYRQKRQIEKEIKECEEEYKLYV